MNMIVKRQSNSTRYRLISPLRHLLFILVSKIISLSSSPAVQDPGQVTGSHMLACCSSFWARSTGQMESILAPRFPLQQLSVKFESHDGESQSQVRQGHEAL